MDKLQAIALDLALCDLSLALTKGRLKQKYARQRKACLDEIKRMNKEDGLDQMTADEIMKELES